jgi:phytol kinase
MLTGNIFPLIITFALAFTWLRLNDFMAHRGWVSGPLSRKIIHIGTGPIFVLCWLLFNDHPAARYLAALVPLLIVIQFAMVGAGVVKDKSAVEAMSRTGNPKEILHGPLYYGIVFVLLTVLFWRDSVPGIVALMLLCGGDGLADILGNRFGSYRLPWSPAKSWIGSLGMFFGGWILAIFILAIYSLTGHLPNPMAHYWVGVTVVALVSTLVESLPFSEIDNLTVPAVAVALGYLLF